MFQTTNQVMFMQDFAKPLAAILLMNSGRSNFDLNLRCNLCRRTARSSAMSAANSHELRSSWTPFVGKKRTPPLQTHSAFCLCSFHYTGWFRTGFAYWIIIIPNILGSIVPHLIINQQRFWTLLNRSRKRWIEGKLTGKPPKSQGFVFGWHHEVGWCSSHELVRYIVTYHKTLGFQLSGIKS